MRKVCDTPTIWLTIHRLSQRFKHVLKRYAIFLRYTSAWCKNGLFKSFSDVHCNRKRLEKAWFKRNNIPFKGLSKAFIQQKSWIASYRRVLKPGTSKHRNTRTLRNTGTAKKPQNTELKLTLLSYFSITDHVKNEMSVQFLYPRNIKQLTSRR